MPGRQVTIVEVGPRDGLQNESSIVQVDQKLRFITDLIAAGLRHIEVTSFVHPRAVPQLADAAEVIAGLPQAPGVTCSALVPNERGLQRAIQARIPRIAVFTAASDEFALKNIKMTIAESLKVFEPVVARARSAGITVRGYISTCFVCPYSGEVPKERVRDVTEALLGMGVDQVAISDTVGAAVPSDIERTVGHVLQAGTADRLALHLHDTYGTALANVVAGLGMGITTFDSSAGGLGGCPFAPGASGNLATEDLVYLLDRMGYESGVGLMGVARASAALACAIGRRPTSRQWQRLASEDASLRLAAEAAD